MSVIASSIIGVGSDAMSRSFSIDTYTGTGAAQTVTAGMRPHAIWIKALSTTGDHYLFDTSRGIFSRFALNTTEPNQGAGWVSSSSATGFTLATGANPINAVGASYASWSFADEPGFFDIATANSPAGLKSHGLAAAPGMIWYKPVGTDAWYVYHRALNGGTTPENYYLLLNSSSLQALNTAVFGTAPTSAKFSIGADLAASGFAYAYLFGHETGSNWRVKCDSFTTDGSGAATVNLGARPQALLYKRYDASGDWYWVDATRGSNAIVINSDAAQVAHSVIAMTSTGFTVTGAAASGSFVFIAIRAES